MTQGLVQVAWSVTDVPRATRFFRDVVGLPLLFETGGLTFFDLGGGVRLMVTTPPAPAQGHRNSILYLRVPDIAAAHATLVARGVRFVEAPFVVGRAQGAEHWLAVFTDPEENLVGLMEARPAAA